MIEQTSINPKKQNQNFQKIKQYFQAAQNDIPFGLLVFHYYSPRSFDLLFQLITDLAAARLSNYNLAETEYIKLLQMGQNQKRGTTLSSLILTSASLMS